MNMYDACEQAYKNGYHDALDEEKLCYAICSALQQLPMSNCHMPCIGQGICSTCKLIAHAIRVKQGVA